MTASATHSSIYVRRCPRKWRHTAASAILLSWVLVCSFARALPRQGNGGSSKAPASVHGTVLNRVTHEPVGRALVFSIDQQFATLTDDRGHFEFKFPPPEAEPTENLPPQSDPDTFRARQLRSFQNSSPRVFEARKPGFLQRRDNPSFGRATASQSEMTLYLDPESLIVGNVNLQGMGSDLRFHLELYRREVGEGQEHWVSAGTFTSWADGEFRFSGLTSGTYKLVTDEQLDRDPYTFTPGGQLFGYAPTFYPGTSDFAAATAIQLGAGETFQANVSPTRREYYAVKIPLANAPLGQQLTVQIHRLGHPGPGYSLGYNPAEQLILGFLPDGDYTLQAKTYGQSGSTGIQNFSIQGAALEGPALNLVPNPSLTVNVKEEFNSGQSVFESVSAEPPEGPSQTAHVPRINVQVLLTALEEFGQVEGAASQPLEDTPERALVIQNVRPGRYRVRVESGVGFAASVLSGGSDLLHEPLVVSMGGSNSPIQVTLRDDGAEVTGEVEGAMKTDRDPYQADESRPQYHLYFLPLGGSGQFREALTGTGVTFTQEQLPPGTYRVLAFDSPREDLAYPTQEALGKLESKGQVIRVVSGQKEKVRLKIISGSDLP